MKKLFNMDVKKRNIIVAGILGVTIVGSKYIWNKS